MYFTHTAIWPKSWVGLLVVGGGWGGKVLRWGWVGMCCLYLQYPMLDWKVQSHDPRWVAQYPHRYFWWVPPPIGRERERQKATSSPLHCSVWNFCLFPTRRLVLSPGRKHVCWLIKFMRNDDSFTASFVKIQIEFCETHCLPILRERRLIPSTVQIECSFCTKRFKPCYTVKETN